MKFMQKLILIAMAAIVFLAGCGKEEQTEEAHNHQHITNSGDIQESTASAEILPTFLEGQQDVIILAYQVAAAIPEKMQGIPCYCGCGESAGHRNNFNCFIKEINETEIIWDDHGTRCGVCVEIALMTASMAKDGHSISDIKEAVDKKYEVGYAKPTSL